MRLSSPAAIFAIIECGFQNLWLSNEEKFDSGQKGHDVAMIWPIFLL
jgi:hypothetical protein